MLSFHIVVIMYVEYDMYLILCKACRYSRMEYFAYNLCKIKHVLNNTEQYIEIHALYDIMHAICYAQNMPAGFA